MYIARGCHLFRVKRNVTTQTSAGDTTLYYKVDRAAPCLSLDRQLPPSSPPFFTSHGLPLYTHLRGATRRGSMWPSGSWGWPHGVSSFTLTGLISNSCQCSIDPPFDPINYQYSSDPFYESQPEYFEGMFIITTERRVIADYFFRIPQGYLCREWQRGQREPE
jgi:hypothetical protein